MRFPIIALALTTLPVAQADDWPAPVIREAFSHSRAYFVRVVPGKSFGDTVGFSGAAKGPFATAEFYRLEKERALIGRASWRGRGEISVVGGSLKKKKQ